LSCPEGNNEIIIQGFMINNSGSLYGLVLTENRFSAHKFGSKTSNGIFNIMWL